MDKQRNGSAFLRFMSSFRLSRLIFALALMLVFIPLLTHYYLAQLLFISNNSIRQSQNAAQSDPKQHPQSIPDVISLPNKNEELPSEQVLLPASHEFFTLRDLQKTQAVADLYSRVSEMMKIRSSVISELRLLESKRQRLQNDLLDLQRKLEELRTKLNRRQSDLARAQTQLEQAEYARKEANMKNQPFIAMPLPPLPSVDNVIIVNQSSDDKSINEKTKNYFRQSQLSCTMARCFDYSRCSISYQFTFYVYDTARHQNVRDLTISNRNHISTFVSSESNDNQFLDRYNRIFRTLSNSTYHTSKTSNACVFIVPILSKSQIVHLPKLKEWNNGINHILLNLIQPVQDISELIHAGCKAIIVQSQFSVHTFRPNFDVILGYVSELFTRPNSEQTSRSSKYPHSPAKRKYFLSCIYKEDHVDRVKSSFETQMNATSVSAYIEPIQTLLHRMQEHSTGSEEDQFYLDFDSPFRIDPADNLKMFSIYAESTFTLIIPGQNLSLISSERVARQLYVALSTNSIPVLVGSHRLAFDEVLDWSLVGVRLPFARISELHFILRSFTDAQILTMRRTGQMFLKRYLADFDQIFSTVLGIIRQNRLQMPAMAAPAANSKLVYDSIENTIKFYEVINDNAIQDNSLEPEDNLGPMESPFPSISFKHNLTTVISNGYLLWNSIQWNPFYTFPNSPFEPILPSEAKFVGSSFGFRPIKNGWGGSGREFTENLGGNYPKEQFTIVMLTYERETVLLDSLQRLKGLPYLNKILVIWNSPSKPPSPELRWPDVGVEIVVVKAERNSLNNRFLPYKEIETEAILSMDDDAHLRHDEIIFGFRVWRESRDRIVGFPGRYHAWSTDQNQWYYNSNYSCELSMVLTGAAFFHKYYTYLYTMEMSSEIRQKIDQYMNCEDIAMNFLVSHITRKPPLKVTSRWTFRCPACPASLSEDESHFIERHDCINYFSQVYGYNPLLNTQFRADSVLFKTRIPHNKQKCFKFI